MGAVPFASLPRVAMDDAALTLLIEDKIACKLVATWPRVPLDLDDDFRVAHWSRLAGVHPYVVQNKMLMLFGNGFCDATTGSSDERALRFVRALAMQALPRRAAPKAKKEPEKESAKDTGQQG